MATVTQQEVAPMHRQLSVTLQKEDYLPQFEKSLKEYSRKAAIPGFRKGMVPAGLIRKMYGSSLFTDEVLKTVDREVFRYIETEKLDIFAQPLPVDMNLGQLDVNQPNNYTFTFEVGMKPEFAPPALSAQTVKRYKVDITDAMMDEEVERLRTRYGNMTEPEAVTGDENVLNVSFTETGADGGPVEGGVTKDNSLLVKYFREPMRASLMGKKAGDRLSIRLTEAFEGQELTWVTGDLGIPETEAAEKTFDVEITKLGLVEPRELNEEFFAQLFPGEEIKTEEAFRQRLREELQKQWDGESRNQLQHSLYHILLEGTPIAFPDSFLKRWLRTQGEGSKSEEEVEQEFPGFLNGLKWSLITDKLVRENDIQVQQDDLRAFAKQQLLGYMGSSALDEEQQWVRDYIDRMMKDRKYVEDAYNRIQTQKLFEWAETQVQVEETPVSREEFIRMNEEHKHEHGE